MTKTPYSLKLLNIDKKLIKKTVLSL